MQTAAWLILALPLAGCIINALGYRLPDRTNGIVGTAAIEPCTVAQVVQARGAAAGLDSKGLGGFGLKCDVHPTNASAGSRATMSSTAT